MSDADQTDDEDLDWVKHAVAAAEEKLGADTIVIDVASVLSIVGYFVITSGRNSRQVRAIGEEIEAHLTRLGGPKPRRIEGSDDYKWLLMDFGGFVVHVFDDETREYFDLDRLWSDQPRIEF